ncbi:MAG: flagellar M-ring protein FliF C-terminal domain-containing protein, partial [Bryobacteraceae bacterium]
VLVDYGVRWAGVGPKAKRIVEPPTPQKLQTIKDLVAAAIGFTPARGDQLVIEALPFESTLMSEPPEQPAPAAKPNPLDALKKSPIAIGAGVTVALVLALGLFAIFRRKKKHGAIDIAPRLPETPAKGVLPSPEGIGNRIEAALAERDAAQNLQMEEFVAALRLPKVTTKKAEALTKHIAEQAKKDPAAMAHVLRGWLQEEGN